MDVLESMEVRWFFVAEDERLRALEALFDGVVIEHDRRCDSYYVDPRRADVGLKERREADAPAKCEVKCRVASLGALDVAPGIAGTIERWTKVSFRSAEPAIATDERRIDVTKKRQLRKFTLAGGAVTEVPASARPVAGCGVELTRFEATRGHDVVRGVTLGFEAFGPAEDLRAALVGAVQRVFGDRPVQLDAADSCGYPAWLAKWFPRGKQVTAGAPKPDGPDLEFWRIEYERIGSELARNEDAGEGRVSLYLTLWLAAVASVATWATALTSDQQGEVGALLVGAVALLFVLGLVTLRRIVDRNHRTDELSDALDRLRALFVPGDANERFSAALPWHTGAPKPKRHAVRHFGLLYVVYLANAATLGLATFVLMPRGAPWRWSTVGCVSLLALLAQCAYVDQRNGKAFVVRRSRHEAASKVIARTDRPDT
jgi:hypothetical protein